MARLRVLSGRDVCEILSRHGFTLVRQRGSHAVTLRRVTVDVRFHPYTSSTWTTYTVTLALGETRQYSFAAIFPGISGQGEMAMNYQSGGSWLGYVVRTDNGTNDGLLEIPYKFNLLAWPN